jgi:hypothetical protein
MHYRMDGILVWCPPAHSLAKESMKMAEASGGRTGEGIDNKGNLLESIWLSDQNLNFRRGLAQF